MLKVALVALNAEGYQSLALGYLRAFAESRPRLAGKVAFQTLDLTVDLDPWWVAYRVLGLEPDVVALSVTCWNAAKAYDVARIVGSVRPETVVVLGGPEVTPIAEEVLAANPEVGAVVRGEGEETFAEVCDTLVRGRNLWRVEGVTARRDGEVVSAPDRPLLADLDTLPSPYLTGVLQPLPSMSYVETYRGCPHSCAYCFEGKGTTRVRTFAKERTEAEVALLARAGVESFSFIDPVFNLSAERLGWLADLLAPYAEAGVRLHTVEVDIERIDGEAAALLKRAGAVSVETGPQTIGADALEACRRPFDPRRFAAGVRALRAAGIRVECDLIIGLPGDRADDIVDGLRFLLALDPGRIQASSLHVLPGTELWARGRELGLVFDERPPHTVMATAETGFQDLRRAEVLAGAFQAVYHATL